MFLVLSGVAFVISVLRSLTMTTFFYLTSKKMYEKMFQRVMMSRILFFELNPIGKFQFQNLKKLILFLQLKILKLFLILNFTKVE